jgi:hypothetical protein
MPRKPAKHKPRNPTRGATPARDYEIGDQVFFSFAGTAGEGLFIGQLREDATCLVLAVPGEPGLAVPATCCSPTGHIEPKLGGHDCRRAYMKQFPKKLLGNA